MLDARWRIVTIVIIAILVTLATSVIIVIVVAVVILVIEDALRAETAAPSSYRRSVEGVLLFEFCGRRLSAR